MYPLLQAIRMVRFFFSDAWSLGLNRCSRASWWDNHDSRAATWRCPQQSGHFIPPGLHRMLPPCEGHGTGVRLKAASICGAWPFFCVVARSYWSRPLSFSCLERVEFVVLPELRFFFLLRKFGFVLLRELGFSSFERVEFFSWENRVFFLVRIFFVEREQKKKELCVIFEGVQFLSAQSRIFLREWIFLGRLEFFRLKETWVFFFRESWNFSFSFGEFFFREFSFSFLLRGLSWFFFSWKSLVLKSRFFSVLRELSCFSFVSWVSFSECCFFSQRECFWLFSQRVKLFLPWPTSSSLFSKYHFLIFLHICLFFLKEFNFFTVFLFSWKRWGFFWRVEFFSSFDIVCFLFCFSAKENCFLSSAMRKLSSFFLHGVEIFSKEQVFFFVHLR